MEAGVKTPYGHAQAFWGRRTNRGGLELVAVPQCADDFELGWARWPPNSFHALQRPGRAAN